MTKSIINKFYYIISLSFLKHKETSKWRNNAIKNINVDKYIKGYIDTNLEDWVGGKMILSKMLSKN